MLDVCALIGITGSSMCYACLYVYQTLASALTCKEPVDPRSTGANNLLDTVSHLSLFIFSRGVHLLSEGL